MRPQQLRHDNATHSGCAKALEQGEKSAWSCDDALNSVCLWWWDYEILFFCVHPALCNTHTRTCETKTCKNFSLKHCRVRAGLPLPYPTLWNILPANLHVITEHDRSASRTAPRLVAPAPHWPPGSEALRALKPRLPKPARSGVPGRRLPADLQRARRVGLQLHQRVEHACSGRATHSFATQIQETAQHAALAPRHIRCGCINASCMPSWSTPPPALRCPS